MPSHPVDNKHFEKNEKPDWAQGMTQEQMSAVRREALRLCKRPAELVHDWILELSEKLTHPDKAA